MPDVIGQNLAVAAPLLTAEPALSYYWSATIATTGAGDSASVSGNVGGTGGGASFTVTGQSISTQPPILSVKPALAITDTVVPDVVLSSPVFGTPSITISGTIAATEVGDTAIILPGAIHNVIGNSVTIGAAALPTPTASNATSFITATEQGDSALVVARTGWSGTIAATEAGDSAAVLSLAARLATIAVTEVGDAATISGTQGWTGTIARTETADTASSSGVVAWAAIVAAPEGRDTASISGQLGIIGSIATTEAADVAALIQSPAGPYTGTIAAVEVGDSSSAAGTVVNRVAIAATETRDAAALAGYISARATIAATEQADSGFTIVQVAWSGSVNATEGGDAASISAIVATDTAGGYNLVEAPDFAIIEGTVGRIGSIVASEESSDISSTSGYVIDSRTGEITGVGGADTADIVGVVHHVVTIAAREESDSSLLLGGIVPYVSVEAVEGPDSANIAGEVWVGPLVEITGLDMATSSIGAQRVLYPGEDPAVLELEEAT